MKHCSVRERVNKVAFSEPGEERKREMKRIGNSHLWARAAGGGEPED